MTTVSPRDGRRRSGRAPRRQASAARRWTPVSQSGPGDHLCLVSGDRGERRMILSAFLGEGLRRRERVLYLFADPNTAASVLDFLEQDAWRRYVDSGQLGVAPAKDVFSPGEAFLPPRVIETLRHEVETSLAAGWQGLRVTSDLDCPVTESGTKLLLEYENAVHTALAGLPVTVVCQYDRRRLGHAVLESLMRAHTGRVGVDPLVDDGAMRIFQTFDPPGLRVEGSVDARTCAAFADALAEAGDRVDDDGDTHLDLGELQFIDLDGLRHLAWAASQLPEGHRLVLDRLAAHHRDLIALLRWDEIPGLRFGGGRA